MNCPTCSSPVRVIGNTTKHYEPLCEFEEHKRKLDIIEKRIRYLFENGVFMTAEEGSQYLAATLKLFGIQAGPEGKNE